MKNIETHSSPELRTLRVPKEESNTRRAPVCSKTLNPYLSSAQIPRRNYVHFEFLRKSLIHAELKYLARHWIHIYLQLKLDLLLQWFSPSLSPPCWLRVEVVEKSSVLIWNSSITTWPTLFVVMAWSKRAFLSVDWTETFAEPFAVFEFPPYIYLFCKRGISISLSESSASVSMSSILLSDEAMVVNKKLWLRCCDDSLTICPRAYSDHVLCQCTVSNTVGVFGLLELCLTVFACASIGWS